MQTKRKSGKCLASVHAANVDEIADGEPHDPDSGPEDDTTEGKPPERKAATTPTQTTNGRRIGAMGRQHSAGNSQCRRFVGSKWDHVVDPQTEQDVMEVSKNDCQAQRRLLDQACLQLEPSDINEAQMASEDDQPRDGKTISTHTGDNSDLTNDTTHGKRLCQRTSTIQDPPSITTTTTTRPATLGQPTHANRAHDRDEGGADDNDDDDTPLILSQIIES